jgi:hypothetical protein
MGSPLESVKVLLKGHWLVFSWESWLGGVWVAEMGLLLDYAMVLVLDRRLGRLWAAWMAKWSTVMELGVALGRCWGCTWEYQCESLEVLRVEDLVSLSKHTAQWNVVPHATAKY